MKKYSITKYFRNEKQKEEWTSISDIGKVYDGMELDTKEYKRVEDAYVNAILEIAQYMNIDTVRIKDVFRWKDLKKEVTSDVSKQELYRNSLLSTYEYLNNNSIITISDLDNIIRLELREDIGGLLYASDHLKIFIGDDFMMGVHSSVSLEPLFERIKSLGLNIYQFL